MEDVKIVELYWQRDEGAIRETDSKYGAFCQRIAMNILGSFEDCEECVSDTYGRCWDTMPPQRPVSLRAYVGEDREMAKALGDLIEIRVAKKAINSKRAIQSLLRTLDRLSEGRREDKLLLLDQSITNSWKGIFPLKGRPAPREHDAGKKTWVAREEVPTW